MLTLLLAITLTAPDLRLEVQRQSLTGTHYRYRQFIDGLPVVGGELNVTVRPDGSREEHRSLALMTADRQRGAGNLVWVNEAGVARLARRETAVRDLLPQLRYIDPKSGAVIREVMLAYPGKSARVFDPNPVVKLNAPELRDRNDQADAVPGQAYSETTLLDVHQSGPLGGPWVQIADFQAPFIAPAEASQPLLFDRSESGFEDVNAYFHIDRTQRHLQMLGYVGERAVAPYPIETDTHAAGGTDNSFFIPSSSLEGRGRLHFGDGGVDDAEDSDLIVHEYAHAIHEWISPGTFLGSSGSEARAISEGFGDYFAFAAKYEAARASGRDPFCFADWDARCWEGGSEACAYPPGSDCLRRLDSPKTFHDFLPQDTGGTEHRNGEIWAAALADILVALAQRHGPAEARRITDTLVIESFFGSPPQPGFETMARRMMAAERYVSGGRNGDVICSAMRKRRILTDCVTVPRGEITHVPGQGTGAVVPDNDARGLRLTARVSDPRPIERLMVAVDIRHTGRGELRLALVAPDGTTVRLHEPSPERAADLVTTFGRDSIPIDSLDVFRGRSAVGEWQLHIVDVAFRDVATVVSWSLVIQFSGEEPSAQRPSSAGRRQVVPVAGYTPGANGTFYRTDLQLLNRGVRETEALLIFTPSAANGTTDFAAVRMMLQAGAVVVLNDVVRTVFASAGLGQIEVAGDVLASTRTWTPGHGGTFGFFTAAQPIEHAIGSEEDAFIVHLHDGSPHRPFRSNVGFAEVAGGTGRVTVTFHTDTGPAAMSVHDVHPHSHLQIAVPALSSPNVHAEFRVEGSARVLGYGATIDNRSGDPTYIPALRRPAARTALIPAISSAGLSGTFWRTELRLLSTGPDVVPLTYATAGTRKHAELTGNARHEDVVVSLFDCPGTRGTIVAVIPDGAFLTARIWTEGPEGTYGQFVPVGPPSVDRVQDILHVEHSETFRTNIGLVTDVESRVRVTILDAAGAALHVVEFALRPLELEQFQVLQPVLGGRARVEVLSGSVYAYGSLVDNRTGDAILVAQ